VRFNSLSKGILVLLTKERDLYNVKMGHVFHMTGSFQPFSRLVRLLLLASLFAAADAAFGAALELRYVGVDGQGIDGTVVVLRNSNLSVALAKPQQATIDQLDRAFVPHVLVVPVGSEVSFPNNDSVSHQVYSFSSTKKFQLPLYRGKSPSPVLFDHPGVVTLGCNIHDQMRAYIFVVEAQHYGRTDKSGVWRVDNLLAGDYHRWYQNAVARRCTAATAPRITSTR
jgi:plastocyanin